MRYFKNIIGILLICLALIAGATGVAWGFQQKSLAERESTLASKGEVSTITIDDELLQLFDGTTIKDGVKYGQLIKHKKADERNINTINLINKGIRQLSFRSLMYGYIENQNNLINKDLVGLNKAYEYLKVTDIDYYNKQKGKVDSIKKVVESNTKYYNATIGLLNAKNNNSINMEDVKALIPEVNKNIKGEELKKQLLSILESLEKTSVANDGATSSNKKEDSDGNKTNEEDSNNEDDSDDVVIDDIEEDDGTTGDGLIQITPPE